MRLLKWLNLAVCLALCVAGCAAQLGEDPVAEDSVVSEDAVGVSAEALCSAPVNFTTVRSNNGAVINEGSYKTRSLRSWVNIWFCPGDQPGVNNAWSCAADQCDRVTAANSYRLSGCFDLPSCSGPDCRECTLQSKPSGGSTWSNTGLVLHYQQGYGFATWLDTNNGRAQKFNSYTTENPVRTRQLY